MTTLGIYEKALPQGLSWSERLNMAKECGFDYVEISIDESDARLNRLDWTKEQRLDIVQNKLDSGVGMHSMCLSAHRRFALGSQNKHNRLRAKEIMEKAITLAYDVGIRNIQLAGYDVYPDYEKPSPHSKETFIQNLEWATALAAEAQVMLSMEIMDTKFMSTLSRWQEYDNIIRSPWFTVYPDIGNVSAWNVDVAGEFAKTIDKISAIHLKDTYAVSATKKGQFRDVPFGEGCVDFTRFFKLLKYLNYRGSFVIEQWSEKAENPLLEVKKTKKWIEDKMREAGYF